LTELRQRGNRRPSRAVYPDKAIPQYPKSPA